MVKIKESTTLLMNDGTIDLEAWLANIAVNKIYEHNQLIRNACVLTQLTGQDVATETSTSCFQQGLSIAGILTDLEMDHETIAAAIVYDSYLFADLSIEDISEQLNPAVAKLVEGVERMNAINIMRNTKSPHSRSQLDNVRKMLLAIVDDVRIVLIKIAERLHILRTSDHLSATVQQHLAQEVMQIYAPLANRLGIGQLKWEMEDLSFRYLQPEKYKEIAKGLKVRRIERDQLVKEIINQLETDINELHIRNFKVNGRAKHIHSIYRKMQRKNLEISKIYDAIAVRVLVPEIENCYQVLSLVHEKWIPIASEFDDYIANPKENGYRSLHTAVVAPGDHTFEVQIRTHDMQAEAELGIAAHWAYKEGAVMQQESHERKIEWLRQVLEWQKELVSGTDTPEKSEQKFIEDRIYIFTPNGDIFDLTQGATPLDFAYNIHSEVGHRCRGAKVDGAIVPLTYTLQTGQQVEILTTKEARPSRDWLNPHQHYLTTARAKAKVLHWFKQQDYDRNLQDGKEIIEREMKKLSIVSLPYDDLAEKLFFKKGDDMLAALGRGDLRLSQILNKLPQAEPKSAPTPQPQLQKPSKINQSDIQIAGVGNLLTHIAKCCRPVPGDSIIGYITIGRGIAIHRRDCVNILNAGPQQQQRLIQTEWGHDSESHYPVDVIIQGYDRKGLLHDITSLLTHEKINLLAVSSRTDKSDNRVVINLTLELASLNELSRILDRMRQLPNIIDARRIQH